MLRKLSWVLALLAFFSVPAVYSLGLGEINLHSGINQPLSADIALYSVRPRDADSIQVQLGSEEDFAKAGLQRSLFLSQLRFTVEPRGKQGYVIHVSTDQAVREPLLDLLVQVTWQGGQVQREYSVAISPPELQAAPDASAEQAFGAPLSETTLAAVQQEAPATPETAALAESETAPPPVALAEVEPEVATPTERVAEPEPIAKPAVVAEAPDVVAAPPVKAATATPAKPTVVAKSPEVVAAPPPQPAAVAPAKAVAAKPAEVVAAAPPPKPAAAVPAEPVVSAAPAVAAVEPKPVVKPAVEAKPKAAPKPKPTVVAKPKAAAKVKVAAAGRTEYGPVRPGETLSGIANRALPDRSTTVDQKMQAILRANPDAFIGNNINNLRSGRVLRLPSQNEISAIDARQAALDTYAQVNAWRQRQGMTALAAPALPAAKPQPEAEAAAPQPAEVATAPEAVVTPPPQAELKLIPPLEEAEQAATSATGTDKPAPDSEVAAAQALDSQDLNTRLATLEQQLATMHKLMALKDQQLATLQSKQTISGGPFNADTLIAIIGVLIAGLIAMLMITLRRPQPVDLVRDTKPRATPAVAAPPAQPKSQAPQAAAAVAGTMSAATGIDSEIDVYMAYGRYHQAEDLIKEAMVHDHSNGLKLKLLEVYYAAKDPAAFENAASSVREAAGSDSEIWRKVVVMGRELCPDSLLFGAQSK